MLFPVSFSDGGMQHARGLNLFLSQSRVWQQAGPAWRGPASLLAGSRRSTTRWKAGIGGAGSVVLLQSRRQGDLVQGPYGS